jgi:hypothetical protein
VSSNHKEKFTRDSFLEHRSDALLLRKGNNVGLKKPIT